MSEDLRDFLGIQRRYKNDARTGPPRSREDLILRLRKLKEIGWIRTREQFNDGLVGNTLEDYLNIKENNLILPDSGKYELKAQRLETSSLTTLLHFDPYPRKPESVVVHVLGPIYGWPHEELEGEWSFRITMYANDYTNRGFKISLDEKQDRLVVEFDPTKVDATLDEWLKGVLAKGGKILSPQPYWPIKEIRARLERKLPNIIYVHAESDSSEGYEKFKYDKATLYEGIDFEQFKRDLLAGKAYADFDARTGHNHGTKFRIRQGQGILERLYSHKENIF